MSASPIPFRFDRDFRGKSPAPGEEPVPLDRHKMELGRAREAARIEGVELGKRETLQSETARVADAVEKLAGLMTREASRSAARAREQEASAIELALALARKLAGGALARFPLAAIEEAAEQCFLEARAAPHVVVRVHERFVEAVRGRLGAIAAERGFAGKLVVLGDPEIAAGDARLEWADGGVVRDRAEISRLIGAAVERHLVAPTAGAGDKA